MNLKEWTENYIKSINENNLEEKLNSLLEKNVPTNPSKWSYYKSQAKKKFDVYPSAYANAWAAKKYKAAGGGWKKESVNEDLPTKQIDPSEFPNPLSNTKGFLKKGNYDGESGDDIVPTKPVSISVSQLKPSQDAIYLGKVLGMAIVGIEGGDLGAVISKDNYILDGHHRYAATTFNNPSAKVGGVQSDLVIGDLIPVLRAVGDAMKNKRGLEPKGGDVNIFKATMDDVKSAIYDGKNMDSKFYNKEKSIAWFENIGEDTIAKRLKMLQSKRPPSGAPARKDMPKIKPSQLGILKTLLNKGNIDVREPYTESVNEEQLNEGLGLSIVLLTTALAQLAMVVSKADGGRPDNISFKDVKRKWKTFWAHRKIRKISKRLINDPQIKSMVDSNTTLNKDGKIIGHSNLMGIQKILKNKLKPDEMEYLKYGWGPHLRKAAGYKRESFESVNEAMDNVDKVLYFIKKEIKRGHLNRLKVDEDEIIAVASKYKIRLNDDEVDEIISMIDTEDNIFESVNEITYNYQKLKWNNNIPSHKDGEVLRGDKIKVNRVIGTVLDITKSGNIIIRRDDGSVFIIRPNGKIITKDRDLKPFVKSYYSEESVNEVSEPDVITQLRDIVSKKQNKKIKDPKSGKKMTVDLYSASAVTQVYDALKQQSNKDKFVSQGLLGMVNLAFKLLKKESVNEAYVVMYAKKKGEKPAAAAYRDKDMALKFEKDLKNDGYITMVIQKKVKGVDESVNESNDTYFNTASQAVDYARKMIEKRGFEIDEDDWNTGIVQGGKYNRLRPGVGKTHSYSIGLLKNGKPQRKELQISLYGMPSGNYELTYYVN